MMKNKRSGTRAITSGEVYKLVNEISAMHGSVYGLQFAVTSLKLVTAKSKIPSSRPKGPLLRRR